MRTGETRADNCKHSGRGGSNKRKLTTSFPVNAGFRNAFVQTHDDDDDNDDGLIKKGFARPACPRNASRRQHGRGPVENRRR